MATPADDETARVTLFIECGAELAGASVGAAIGLVGGPPGAIGGATVGVAATRLIRRLGADIQERLLAPRQRMRAGAAFAVAAEEISRRLQAGELLRADGFFDTSANGRPAADELLEGVLLAAADAYEERKVECLGKLYAALAFDETISRAHANYTIALAQRLTYRQFALMAVIWDRDIEPIAEAAMQEEPSKQLLFSDELAIEVDELERLGLVGRGVPGGSPQRRGAAFVDASGVGIRGLTLTGPGKRLYDLMEFHNMPTDARREVTEALNKGWST
ncbi:MAG: hypothetical protein ACYCU0_02340 [Solirubrobacteraceae bacterium]